MQKSKFLTEDNFLELVLDSFILNGKVENCFSFSMQHIAIKVSFWCLCNSYGKWATWKWEQLMFKISVSGCWKAYYVCFYLTQFALEFVYTWLFCVRFRNIISWLSSCLSTLTLGGSRALKSIRWVKDLMERRNRRGKNWAGKDCVFCLLHCFSGMSIIRGPLNLEV